MRASPRFFIPSKFMITCVAHILKEKKKFFKLFFSKFNKWFYLCVMFSIRMSASVNLFAKWQKNLRIFLSESINYIYIFFDFELMARLTSHVLLLCKLFPETEESSHSVSQFPESWFDDIAAKQVKSNKLLINCCSDSWQISSFLLEFISSMKWKLGVISNLLFVGI